ncbi:MAG: hypothetical protein JNJ44_00680, partial [Zoogloeaceae bacterium]|nr:hypothetical protein [Zoogloeaceae bacterium]
MHASATFARRWWLAAKFPIGADETASLDQIALPNGPIPTTNDAGTDCALGFELGQAALKLGRPWPMEAGEESEPDVAPDYISELLLRIGSGPAVQFLRMGFLCAPEALVEVALNAPSRLPAITERLDKLDDALIRARIAYVLEKGEALPTIFDEGFVSTLAAGRKPRALP